MDTSLLNPGSFINPYPDDGKHLMARIAGDCYDPDYRLVQRIRTVRGTSQTTINILWKKLCNELRTRGITDYTREVDFVDFVTRCQLILPEERGTTTGAAVPETNVRDVLGRTAGTGATHPTTPNLPHDIPSSGRNRKSGTGGNKTVKNTPKLT